MKKNNLKSTVSNISNGFQGYNVFDSRAIAIYVRQSVEKDNSNSIENQINICKNSLTLADANSKIVVYSDEGKSGKNINREGFQNLMADVRAGKIKRIHVYKLDRFSRSLADFCNVWQEMKEYNVAISSASESFDTQSPYGEMILKILMVFAEFERTCIQERIRDSVESRANLGLYPGGQTPIGYGLEEIEWNNYTTKKFVHIEDEIKQIKYIFDLYSRGGISLGRVQKALIEEGYDTIRNSTWTTSKIKDVLHNPVYAKADLALYDYFYQQGIEIIGDMEEFDGSRGIYFYGKRKNDINEKKVVLAPHAGFIESSQWIRVQELLSENKQILRSDVGGRSWLSGLVMCGKCGSNMSVTSYNDRRYFSCNTKKNKKKCTGPNGAVYIDDLEEYIFEQISSKISSLKKKYGIMSDESKHKYFMLELELRKLMQEDDRIGTLLVETDLDADLLETVTKKKKEIKSKSEDVKSKMSSLVDSEQKYEDLSPLKRKWRNANYSEKRSVAGSLIKKIVVQADGGYEIILNV